MSKKSRLLFYSQVLITSLFLLLVLSIDAYAGAWTLPRNKVYLETAYQEGFNREEYASDGKKRGFGYGGAGSEHSTFFKLEYGLTDQLNLLTQLPYRMFRFKNDFDKFRTSDWGDVTVGAKYRLIEEPAVVSMQADVKVPGGYSKDRPVQIGDGQNDLELRLILSKSFLPILPFYTSVESGFTFRQKIPSNEIPFSAELGFYPHPKILLKGYITGINSMKSSGEQEEDLYKWGSSVGFTLIGDGSATTLRNKKALTLEAGYEEVFAGKNTSAAGLWVMKVFSIF